MSAKKKGNKKKRSKVKVGGKEKATYDHYAALEDDSPYELVDGTLEVVTPSPTPKHQLVRQKVLSRLEKTCQSEYIILVSPIDVILSETEVRQPDIVMIHHSRLHMITKRGVEGAPDLVVEIVSPSSIKRDRGSKQKAYAQYAIPEYWIVDPIHGSLEQYVLVGKHYQLREVYHTNQTIRSKHVACVSFTMDRILSKIPELPEES